MEGKQLDLISEVLSNEDLGAGVLLEFERLGHPAFDEICLTLRAGMLTPTQQVLALRRLALLGRHFCANRKEELLDFAFERMESDNEIVRSGAVNTAIWISSILKDNPNLASRPENKPGAKPSLEERVKASVRRAVQLGIDQVQRNLAEEYLSGSSKGAEGF